LGENSIGELANLCSFEKMLIFSGDKIFAIIKNAMFLEKSNQKEEKG